MIVLVGVAIAVLAGAATASASSDTLLGGQTLASGQTLVSGDGHYELAMQGDGNLVLYWLNGSATGRVLWDTNTSGDAGAHALLQPNGNLVLLDPSNNTLWSSNTSGAGCANLIVQGDGNLVLYNGQGAFWATHTVQTALHAGDELFAAQAIFSPNEQYELVMQGDGNLVLYGPPGALWSSTTSQEDGNHAILQSDGNLVVYNPYGRAMWNSKTNGHPGDYAAAQSDGNFVIYGGGKALWDTATNGRTPSTGPVKYQHPAFTACPPPPPPPAPPAAPPTDPIVKVPVATRLKRLRVKVSMDWTWNRAVTRLHRIAVPHLPRGATVTVTCEGKRCGPHRRLRSGRRHLKRLLHTLDGRRFRAGSRLVITIAEHGHRAERIVVRIRYGSLPRVHLLGARHR